MCGIYAEIKTGALHASEEKARWACAQMKHRGPNAEGVAQFRLPWAGVTLGMTRLKVVDQTDLTVPYDFIENLGVLLTFNGEIYNWREVRGELSNGRVQWKTQCDAEVLAAAWRFYGGVKCLDKLNGMWGFVLVDTLTNEVLICRDRAGEKPLYYSWWRKADGPTLYAASEIKALPVELREARCLDMDVFEFDCRSDTPFEGVEALMPGHYLHVTQDSCEKYNMGGEKTWWELPQPEPCSMTHDTIVDRTQELLVDAIKIRHVAEVPVAVQLSGGLDSAIVQAVCDNENLYCVTFEADGVDNVSQARRAARGHLVKSVDFSRDELVEVLPRVAYHLDTPATWTAVCQWFMNEYVAEDGNVVVLSGEGADELFGGYSRYRTLYWFEQMLKDQHLEDYGPLIQRVFDMPENVLARMLNRGDDCADLVHAKSIVHWRAFDGSLVERMMHLDFYTTMQVLLRMADRMAAAFSLENRSPFFDYRLMEWSTKIPLKYKVDAYESKIVLRRVAYRLGVDQSIVEEKTKKGLYVPPSWAGDGPKWDRRWFSTLMNAAWCERCLRPAPDVL